MLTNILDELLKILRGKNGTVFLIIFAVITVMFVLNILPYLIKFLIFGAIAFFAFKYFENKKKG